MSLGAHMMGIGAGVVNHCFESNFSGICQTGLKKDRKKNLFLPCSLWGVPNRGEIVMNSL